MRSGSAKWLYGFLKDKAAPQPQQCFQSVAFYLWLLLRLQKLRSITITMCNISHARRAEPILLCTCLLRTHVPTTASAGRREAPTLDADRSVETAGGSLERQASALEPLLLLIDLQLEVQFEQAGLLAVKVTHLDEADVSLADARRL